MEGKKIKPKISAYYQSVLDSGRVCRRCGGKLEPIETVDNSNNPAIWVWCPKCNCFDCGVEKKVFQIAKKLVIENREYYYSHMNVRDYKTPQQIEYFNCTQIGGMSGLVESILRLSKEEKPTGV